MLSGTPPRLALALASAIASASFAGFAAAQPETDPIRQLKPSLDGELPGTEEPSPERLLDPAGGPVSVPNAPENDPASPPAGPDQPAEGNASGENAAPPSEQSAAPPEPPRPLRLGVIAGRDLRATMARIEPVAEDLTRLLGRPVEMLPMSSYRAMIDAQVQQRIDGGFYSASAYALADGQCRCLEPIVAPAAFDGTTAFHAVILAPRNSGIASAADLEGKVVAAGAADSVGNRRMQLAGLLAEGIDPGRFAGMRDVESGAEAVRLMLSGAADASFAWSSLAGDQQAGYSRGTLADLVAAGEIEMTDVAVVWRSPAIPHGPVAVLKALPDNDKNEIETYLLGLETENPTAYDALNPFFAGGYQLVEPGDYEPLAILSNEAIDDLSLRSSPLGNGSAEPVATNPDREAGRR